MYCPVLFKIQDRPCVVVGGGKVALRKIRMLVEAGAHVMVISPEPDPEILELAREGRVELIRRDYERGDLTDVALAIAATDMRSVNREVVDEARRARVPINVADDPDASDFIIPSFFRRGALTVAISTSGTSPALARKLRTRLEKEYGAEYGALVSLVGEVRSTLRKRGVKVTPEAWQEALDLDVLLNLVKSGRRDDATAFLLERLVPPRDAKP
jgi:siroheme synthase-like protein